MFSSRKKIVEKTSFTKKTESLIQSTPPFVVVKMEVPKGCADGYVNAQPRFGFTKKISTIGVVTLLF